ncbi:PDR/VanB family oxidoreductase [Belnapia rosea]|uniref:PDR/VanB family oxidoreductase n=1 Tax=Belnapia rosea TaxID=938405 RepID=UPI00088D412D|nr:PDR/VanB family oxidoreductase [Belnapia rosea]SDB64501.1 vanillate O-demethylase ferredoxin subunit [Belnapia rosea]
MTARIIQKLRVVAVAESTPEVRVYTLEHPRKPLLPDWSAGAHVDLRLPDGRMRQYSLCGEPGPQPRWQIAVKRETVGRGGSAWVHDSLALGTEVQVSAPRNNFPLAAGAVRHVLVGGGIGVTPLLAMARSLAAQGADFTFHLCARSAALAPLLAELRAVCGERLATWFGDEGRRFDAALIGMPEAGVHLYACGPHRLIEAVRAAAAERGWAEAQQHYEVFQPTLDENFKPEPFELRIASTGEVLLVPAGRSALDVLRERGFALPSSCELGVCGSCVCGYRDGIVIHRDSVLPVSARQDRMTLCVSRARVSVTVEL